MNDRVNGTSENNTEGVVEVFDCLVVCLFSVYFWNCIGVL